MHEIRASVPPDCVAATVRLAHEAGIDRVAVSDIFVHGPNHDLKLVSVETSTPTAKAFVDAILNSPVLAKRPYTLTSRELRAIVGAGDVDGLTQPLSEPFPDVIQDFWQGSHVNASYAARAAAGAALLASGIIENNPVAIVVAALFLPFLAQVLTVSFGLWSRDFRLARQGAGALGASIGLALAAGAVVAAIEGGPILFEGFKHPLASFAISALIGGTAGLSAADDTGRRYLIGVAAAVQLAIFPVWFGAASVIGLPEASEVRLRLASFCVNLVTIAGSAVASYASLHLRGGWKAPRSSRT